MTPLPIRACPLSANRRRCRSFRATRLAAKRLFFGGVNHWQHSMCSSQAWGDSQMNRCGERQNRVELGKLWGSKWTTSITKTSSNDNITDPISGNQGGFWRLWSVESPVANKTWNFWWDAASRALGCVGWGHFHQWYHVGATLKWDVRINELFLSWVSPPLDQNGKHPIISRCFVIKLVPVNGSENGRGNNREN